MAKKSSFADIEKEITLRVYSMSKIGESRHEFKEKKIDTNNVFTSPTTMKNTTDVVKRFMNYQYETRGTKSINQITVKDIDKWLDRGRKKFDENGNVIKDGWEKSTTKVYANDLCKFFNIKGGLEGLGIKLDSVSYLDTTRSRKDERANEKYDRDKNYKYVKHNDPDVRNVMKFCEGAGLRKSEALAIRGDQIQVRPYLNSITGKYEERVCVVFQGKDKNMTKGGRPRIVPVLKEYEQHALNMKNKNENQRDRVFGGDIPKKVAKADIHGDGRRVYAVKLYNELKSRFGENLNKNEQISKSAKVQHFKFLANEQQFREKHGQLNDKGNKIYTLVSRVYETRPEGKKDIQRYDRVLLREVSLALGHFRESTVVESYFN
jgi:integrase